MIEIDREIRAYYDKGKERERLTNEDGTLELVRTQELLQRYLPPPPAAVLDVGGGPGIYAGWLARAGYQVHLVDPVALHVAQAAEVAAGRGEHSFTAAVGDARRLAEDDETFDAVLLMGPLYHLTERRERLMALAEARRVLQPGGVACIVGISRFASLLDALRQGVLDDPEVAAAIERDVREGQHRNIDTERYPGWFTTAYFHHPDELAAEVMESGLELVQLLGIEGPGGFVGDGWRDPEKRPAIMQAARAVEQEPSLLGANPHLLAVARKTA